MAEGSDLAVHRILVALDESEGGAAALEAAVLLGALLRAELEAVFVEDLNLLRLARLPFARELLGASAAQRPLDPTTMERALHSQGERLRRRLAVRLQAADLHWSFAVLRGQVAGELLERAKGADLVILGRAGMSPGRAAALGSTARTLLAAAGCAVLLAHPRAPPAQPVVVVFDASPGARRALALGIRLARRDDNALVVLLPAPVDEALAEQAREMAAAGGLDAQLRPLASRDPRRLAASVHDAGGRILVVGAGSIAERERLGAALSCPVLLVP